jgi:hypothetical protein
MPSSIDYAFPAVDQATIASLGTIDNSVINTSGVIGSITTGELSSLNQSFNSAESSGQNVITYAMMMSRNRTIDSIASDLIEKNLKSGGGLKDTFTRQGEINEWQAQNKLDTLFFLQILFLFFTLLTVLLFLRKYDIISGYSFNYFVLIAIIIVIGVLWNRASYTIMTRDKRLWNRRYIGLDDSGDLSVKCNTPS